MRHKSQSSQFMHPNLCQKGISGLLLEVFLVNEWITILFLFLYCTNR